MVLDWELESWVIGQSMYLLEILRIMGLVINGFAGLQRFLIPYRQLVLKRSTEKGSKQSQDLSHSPMQALDQNISKIESDHTASWQQFETLKVQFPKELFSSSTTDIARGAGPVIAGKCVSIGVCQWVCHQRTRLVGSCMSIGGGGVEWHHDCYWLWQHSQSSACSPLL